MLMRIVVGHRYCTVQFLVRPSCGWACLMAGPRRQAGGTPHTDGVCSHQPQNTHASSYPPVFVVYYIARNRKMKILCTVCIVFYYAKLFKLFGHTCRLSDKPRVPPKQPPPKIWATTYANTSHTNTLCLTVSRMKVYLYLYVHDVCIASPLPTKPLCKQK